MHGSMFVVLSCDRSSRLRDRPTTSRASICGVFVLFLLRVDFPGDLAPPHVVLERAFIHVRVLLLRLHHVLSLLPQFINQVEDIHTPCAPVVHHLQQLSHGDERAYKEDIRIARTSSGTSYIGRKHSLGTRSADPRAAVHDPRSLHLFIVPGIQRLSHLFRGGE